MASKAPVKRNLSAEKRARQTEKRNTKNRAVKSMIKNAIKAVDASVKAKDKEATENALKAAIKTISSAGSKGIIHKNNAARKISKLTKRVNASAATA